MPAPSEPQDVRRHACRADETEHRPIPCEVTAAGAPSAYDEPRRIIHGPDRSQHVIIIRRRTAIRPPNRHSASDTARSPLTPLPGDDAAERRVVQGLGHGGLIHPPHELGHPRLERLQRLSPRDRRIDSVLHPVLFDQWRRWFDKTWQKAAQLTEATVNIPALSPARGSLEAAALWEGYCNVCAETDRIESLDHDPDTGEIRISQEPDGEEESPPTIDLKLPKLDRMADRISRLFSAGQQVAIAHSSAVGPLETPVDPQFFKQQAERRIGTVVQRQSFRISVFSKDELKRLDGYRLRSQNIIKKLALSYGKNLYWLPDEMISILEKEVETKNSEAEADLKELVGGSAGCFVENKIKEIERDLTNIYRELGGKDDLPPRALTKVVRDLELRISKALGSRLLAPITCSRITIPAPANSGWQAPWTQAKELVFSLAKFPRRVIVRPNELSELCTSQEEILGAMNIQNDAILKVESHWERQDRARSQLRELEWIEHANIGDRDRCEAVFMLIDGPQHYDDLRFIRKKEGTSPERT